MKFDQELCSIKLNDESLQKLNPLNTKSIKRKVDRKEQKKSELTAVNDRLVKKLDESLEEKKFFPGIVVCQKPNSDNELVIRCDCEDRLYSFNFSDFQNSVVKLLPVTHADFIGKGIRQKFTNDEENDIWWEQGIVISKDLSNSSDFIVNFFNKEDYDESESSLNVYEVLALPLLDDYLNHDVQFL